ncbi:hypothetical protein HYG86_04210 [Alkalicella caledoniensis]|uniref:Serine-type D-Ala-D-Ala carboxypeptidase n=1 Tax=Alkalicella caledoniensis TaxID=2731377 RepID=A0A7G9W5R9_ALKCA|nr:penicillin-binding transpeptidase domain-containing protein [Alkalicella caledoniensis]QNO14031.1 hypothetical protein HYG86_04210 [Alkalicella caledoniensis]
MKKIGIILCLILSMVIFAGCSSKVENPEDTLKEYLDNWSNQKYDEMFSRLNGESVMLIRNQEWAFDERYEKVYSDLRIDNITAVFEPVDFKGEKIDLEEITEIVYPVDITMDSLAGEIAYTTHIKMVKEKNDEDKENWKVVWHPTQLLTGLESPTDKLSVRTLLPQRGEIFDRNGNGLAINGSLYQVSIVPNSTEDLEETAIRFAKVLGIDDEQVLKLAKQYPHRPDWAAPIQNLALNDPRAKELVAIPGVLLGQIDGRQYPSGDVTGHLIGHMGAITAEELQNRQGQGYTSTSIIGKNNLELVFEETLRGTPGAVISVTDESGKNGRVIAERSSVDGEDVHLTIDIDIQRKLVKSLNGEIGAGVVMDPATGEVLALVSEPAFDSNLRYLGLRDPRAMAMEDTTVLFERRFQNTYSPGSIFKPFTAVMGIEEKTLDPTEKINISGRRWQPNNSWGGYHITRVNESESQVDLNIAMMRSDNIYFAQQALRIGNDKMEAWAEKLGFGEPIPFEFPIYASAIANSGINTEVLLADTGYGQGQILVSPVHMTAMYSIFVNDGSMIQPRLISGNEPEFYRENIASTQTIDKVLNSLIAVVEDNRGSANRSNPGHSRKIAGKTGTAELKKDLNEQGGEQIGWYVSFDYEKKDLVTTIMIQNAQLRGGSAKAVNISNDFWRSIDQ